MRSNLANAASRLATLVRGLALPAEPPSADPGEVQRHLADQQSRLEALAFGVWCACRGRGRDASTAPPCVAPPHHPI